MARSSPFAVSELAEREPLGLVIAAAANVVLVSIGVLRVVVIVVANVAVIFGDWIFMFLVGLSVMK